MSWVAPGNVALWGVLCAYTAVSLGLFNRVHLASSEVVDEQFHLAQGLHWCNGNWSHWEPKLSTPPGLYLLSCFALIPLRTLLSMPCTVYSLRLTSLVSSVLNLYLIASILRMRHGSHLPTSHIIIQAVNLAILPPLYFFSHVYYTDAVSLSCVLLMFWCSMRGKPFGAMCAAFSLSIRQTNVLWVAFWLGNRLLDALYRSYVRAVKGKDSKRGRSSQSLRVYSLRDSLSSVLFHCRTGFNHFVDATPIGDLCEMFSLLAVLAAFGFFIYWNGSIVIGDKSAHVASVHLPQLLYFLLFYGIFSLPILACNVRQDAIRLWSSRNLISAQIVVCLMAVHFNTMVHPYLLADNRHYSFYIWNRWYGRYWAAKYLVIPVYVWVLNCAWLHSRMAGAGFLLPYSVATALSVVPQKLLELRYFLPPFIVLRLWQPPPRLPLLLAETALYVAINILTFKIFFTKEIVWEDFVHVQRLIW